MKKLIFLTIGGLFLVAAIASFRPISVSKENSESIMGIVKSVQLSGTKDLEITLNDDQRTFYINRAAEKDLDIPELIESLPSKNVTLLYADQWTILDPLGSTRHITELTVDKDIIFTELH